MERTERGSRWRVVALCGAVALTMGGVVTASASGASSGSVLVPITPCRLLDTRPAPDHVGERDAALGPNEGVVTAVWGTHGGCTIPPTATGVSLNVTAIEPTASSFLTVYPADAVRPLTANLNWIAGQPPTPNAVTAALSADGRLGLYNLAGFVHLTVDVMGYYEAAGGTASAGPAGPAGPTGPAGPSGPVNRMSDEQIALERWDQDPGRTATFAAGSRPTDIAFDGTHLWIVNHDDGTVSRTDPITGAHEDFPVGPWPRGVVFDGTDIWVISNLDDELSRLNTATGSRVVYPTDAGPTAIAFDGAAIWVAYSGSDTVSRFSRSTGARTTYPAGNGPSGMAFDGTNLWVTNENANSVSKFNVRTGTRTDYAVGAGPTGIAFDGTYLWVANTAASSVSRVVPATGASTAFPSNVFHPLFVTYDGHRVWIAGGNSSTLDVVDPTDGSAEIRAAATAATGIGFDGTSIWVLHAADIITRIAL